MGKSTSIFTKSLLKKILLIFSVMIICFILSYFILGLKNKNEKTPIDTNLVIINSDSTWNLVQNWRKENNLKEFEKSDRLCVIAKDLANDTNIKKISFRDKYWNYPYKIGQVSIYNADSASDVLEEWINTKDNLEILKKDWKYSCLVCEGNNCAQIFSNLEKPN